MFESYTYEYLLNRMLENVPSEVDKREGSLIYDALAPAAVELCQMYIELDVILKETFADTASREYLIKRAAERGITPYPATYAVGKGIFNTVIPLGTRFSIEQYNYQTEELISSDNHSYRMVCETAGEEPNHVLGTLTPIDYVEGLQSAELVDILVPGEEKEDTESIRARYMATFDDQSFGGNRADYIERINALAGVGGVKVYRTWQGGGTVKCVIINSSYQTPSEELIDDVQTAVDPAVNQGEGLGIAPIGHVVTMVGVEEAGIDIEIQITYQEGWSFADCKSYMESTIDGYFLELAQDWAQSDALIVRISQIESRLLEVEGILDVANTKLNGMEKNLTLGADQIPKRGEVIG